MIAEFIIAWSLHYYTYNYTYNTITDYSYNFSFEKQKCIYDIEKQYAKFFILNVTRGNIGHSNLNSFTIVFINL